MIDTLLRRHAIQDLRGQAPGAIKAVSDFLVRGFIDIFKVDADNYKDAREILKENQQPTSPGKWWSRFWIEIVPMLPISDYDAFFDMY